MIQLMYSDIIDNIYIHVYKPIMKLPMKTPAQTTTCTEYRCKVSRSSILPRHGHFNPYPEISLTVRICSTTVMIAAFVVATHCATGLDSEN